MSNEDLRADDAIAKIRELVDAAPTCMMASQLQSIPPHTCPMRIQQVDGEGNLWFFSGADSDHNQHLRDDARVQLIVSNAQDNEYLSVFGNAEVCRDRAKIEELWSTVCEVWFPEGQGDPNLTLIRVRPIKSHYWDTRHGKLVTVAKILGAAVTNGEADIGVEGELSI